MDVAAGDGYVSRYSVFDVNGSDGMVITMLHGIAVQYNYISYLSIPVYEGPYVPTNDMLRVCMTILWNKVTYS